MWNGLKSLPGSAQFHRNVLEIREDLQQPEDALATPKLTSCCVAANRAIARSERRPRGLTHCTRWMRGTELARRVAKQERERRSLASVVERSTDNEQISKSIFVFTLIVRPWTCNRLKWLLSSTSFLRLLYRLSHLPLTPPGTPSLRRVARCPPVLCPIKN